MSFIWTALLKLLAVTEQSLQPLSNSGGRGSVQIESQSTGENSNSTLISCINISSKSALFHDHLWLPVQGRVHSYFLVATLIIGADMQYTKLSCRGKVGHLTVCSGHSWEAWDLLMGTFVYHSYYDSKQPEEPEEKWAQDLQLCAASQSGAWSWPKVEAKQLNVTVGC